MVLISEYLFVSYWNQYLQHAVNRNVGVSSAMNVQAPGVASNARHGNFQN